MMPVRAIEKPMRTGGSPWARTLVALAAAMAASRISRRRRVWVMEPPRQGLGSGSLSSGQRLGVEQAAQDSLAGHRQATQADAAGVGNGIGDRRGDAVDAEL